MMTGLQSRGECWRQEARPGDADVAPDTSKSLGTWVHKLKEDERTVNYQDKPPKFVPASGFGDALKQFGYRVAQGVPGGQELGGKPITPIPLPRVGQLESGFSQLGLTFTSETQGGKELLRLTTVEEGWAARQVGAALENSVLLFDCTGQSE